MYCRFCGKKLEDDWKFCPLCGNPVDGLTRESFERKIERIEISLLVCQIRERLQVVKRDFFFSSERVPGRHKHVQRGRKERLKDQIVLLNEFFDDFFVLVAQIKYADFAF